MKKSLSLKHIILSVLLTVLPTIPNLSYGKLLFTDSNLHQNQYALITGVINPLNNKGKDIFIVNTNNFSNLKNNLTISVAGFSNKKEKLLSLMEKYDDSYIKFTGTYLETSRPISFNQPNTEWVFELGSTYFSNKIINKTHIIEASDKSFFPIVRNEFKREEIADVQITTSIYSISNALIGFLRGYYSIYGGTEFKLTVYDLDTFSFCSNSYQWSHDGGPEAELSEIADLNNDGESELATYSAQDDTLISTTKITCKNEQ